MNKKRVLKILTICLVAYLVFAGITVYLFYSTLYNQVDAIAITYIRSCNELKEQYGEMIYIGKNVFYKTEKTEDMIKSSYGIETVKYYVTVYVTLEKQDEELVAKSWELLEVRGK